MDPLLFVASTMSLLATPGPTNTLLATSGASAGLRRSVHLLAAELCGYLLAITLLRLVLGPFIMANMVLGTAIRLAAAIYLVYLAVVLWRHSSEKVYDSSPVSFSRVFVTTLLNPKAIVFAFALLPLQIGFFDLLPWLSCLSVLISSIGLIWIVLGDSLRREFRGIVDPKFGYRFSSVALTLLAALICIHSFGVA